MSTSTKTNQVNTNEPSSNNRSSERPIYEANQNQNSNSKKSQDDESPDCCFVRTFFCCFRDTT